MKKKAVEGDLFADADFGSTNIDFSDLSVNHKFDALFDRLSKSDFRRKFHLGPKDLCYIRSKGLDVIRRHASDFVDKRLAPAAIPNDGKQTPMRGHPVFLAQHATGCCCRGCFSKWHGITQGRELTPQERLYAVDVIMEWIIRQLINHKQTIRKA